MVAESLCMWQTAAGGRASWQQQPRKQEVDNRFRGLEGRVVVVRCGATPTTIRVLGYACVAVFHSSYTPVAAVDNIFALQLTSCSIRLQHVLRMAQDN